jgi:CheY-like chemotaxis protein
MQRPARILIVEDEPLIAHDLRWRVTRLGYTAAALAATGPEAVQQALAHRPDLVLMDIRLRGTMDGIEAAAVIRTHLDLPVRYRSASVEAMTLAHADATHPAGFLHKPVSDQDLLYGMRAVPLRLRRPVLLLRVQRQAEGERSALSEVAFTPEVPLQLPDQLLGHG